MRSGPGHLFQHGTDRLGDQFQPGQVTHRGQDVGGVGALSDALAHESGLLQARKRQIEDTVGAVVQGQAIAEVGQHAVVEAGIVQFHGVKSARRAVPAFRPTRFSGPLPAPAVRLSTQPAVHKSRLSIRESFSHPVVGHGEGMTDPRWR